MTNNDLNQIRGVVKEEVNTALEPVVKKLDALWDQVVDLSVDNTEIHEILDSNTAILKSHTATLNSHTATLKYIATNTEDSKHNIVKLSKRVCELENHAGIAPLPELTII